MSGCETPLAFAKKRRPVHAFACWRERRHGLMCHGSSRQRGRDAVGLEPSKDRSANLVGWPPEPYNYFVLIRTLLRGRDYRYEEDNFDVVADGVRDFSERSSASRARPNCVLQRDHRSRLLCNRMRSSRLPRHGRIRQTVLWKSSSLWGWPRALHPSPSRWRKEQ